MKKTILLVLAVLSILLFTDRLSAQNKYQGLLWEISGKDMPQPSYLYGTMHVSKKIAFHLSDTFFLALKNVDVIGLETNPEFWLEDMLNSKIYKSMSGLGGRENYKSKLYNSFEVKMPTNKQIGITLSRDPNLTNQLLFRSSGYSDNFEEDTYLDLFIFQSGKKMNKKVVNLEDFDRSMMRVIKSQMPDKDAKPKSYETLRKLFKKSFNEVMEDAYRVGDLDLIDSITKVQYGNPSNYITYMLVLRNEEMANNIDSIIKGGNTIFAGIGAAHLPGNEGVIEMLREHGYTVRSVSNTAGKKSIQLKNKIENTFTPLTLKEYQMDDSFIHYSAPKELLYTSLYNDYRKDYLYPDMANGSFYLISRINHYGELYNYNTNNLIEKIDSLLFENIPGDILKKETIQGATYPGIRITNKTKRGDLQKYEIYITPLEIVMFKLSGTGSYLKKEKASNTFFNTIQFVSKESQWTTYSPLHGEFKVDLPNFIVADDDSKVAGGNQNIQAYDTKTGNYYLVKKTIYHDYEYIEEDTFELNVITENFYKDLSYEKVSSKLITHEKYPALEVKLKNKQAEEYLHLKTIIKGANYYLLAAKTKTADVPEQFLNTFTFTEVKYNPSKKHHDSIMYFSVNTVADVPDLQGIMDIYSTYLKNNKDDDDRTYQKENRKNLFVVNSTGEQIKVEYRKYHYYKHYLETIEEYWDGQLEGLIERNGLIVQQKKMTQNLTSEDSIYQLDVTLIDTGSTRSIKIKKILKNQALYTLTTTLDTLTENTPFISDFFSSFTLADTAIGTFYFEDKSFLFLNDLIMGDSVAVERSVSSMYTFTYTFEVEHLGQLINAIKKNNIKDKEDELDMRIMLIRRLGFISNPKVLPFLNQLYLNSGDTVALQIAILEAVAQQQTIAGSKAFIKLLLHETPLSSDESDVDDMFDPLFDSLEIATPLFPEIFQLVDYPEYKDEIYALLADLLEKKIVDKSICSSYLNKIFKEANDQLKRKLGNETSKSNSYYNYSSSSTNRILENFAKILVPFYDDLKVKTYFDKLVTTTDKEFLVDLLPVYLNNNISFSDTLIPHLASIDELRVDLYNQLKEIGKLNGIDTTLFTQQTITRSLLVDRYNYDTTEKDTILFYAKKEVTLKGEKGLLYFYKVKKHRENNDNWYIAHVGIQPLDTHIFSTKEDMIGKTKLYEEEDKEALEKEIQDYIKETLQECRYVDRKRYSSSYSKNNYLEDYLGRY